MRCQIIFPKEATIWPYSVLDHNEVSLVLKWYSQIAQESIRWFSHDHRTEELTTKPSSTSRRNTSFNNCDFEIGTLLPKHICCAQTTRAGANDDDVRFGEFV